MLLVMASRPWLLFTQFRAEVRKEPPMAQIHAYIYGIAPDGAVRRITVSREDRATNMTLDPLHGSDAAVASTTLANDRIPLQEAKRMFDLDEAVELPADLEGSEVSEKIRADLEVKALARKERAARGSGDNGG
jgi:uncharacterized iron-regulated membrane protein